LSNEKKVLGLVGSPNKDGLTNRLVSKALEGAAEGGISTELVQMSDYVVDACRDCLPWVCLTNLKCTYDDENFEKMNKKILACSGLVLGSPVYWGDTSAMVRLLILKMFRVFARSQPLSGKPAFGIAIAGGSGNGLITGLLPIYHFFRTMWMRAIEPLPVTRFDLNYVEARAENSGQQMAKAIEESQPFKDRDERDFWYDKLHYLDNNSGSERRLLAAITSQAVPEEKKPEIKGNLAKADILTASGMTLESMTEVSKVYDSCVEIINGE